MPMTQTRRRFLTTLLVGRRRGPRPRSAGAGRRRRLRKRPRSAFAKPRHSACAPICRRGAAARRGLHRYPLCRVEVQRRDQRRRSRAAGSDFTTHFAPQWVIGDRQRRTDHGAGRRACRLLRTVRERRHPQHCRSEGQDASGCRRWGRAQHLFVSRHGRACRARSGQGHPLGHQSISDKPIELFADGKIDAFLGFPPEPQELRARHIGHVIVNSAVDRPWSQYFCCMLAGNRNYVRKYPVATKRVVRAILKAADLCATDPARVARRLVDGGFTARYDYALQTLSERPLRQMAGIRSRGHDPVLCAAPARSRHDQVEPAEDHRRRHRLALPERAQTRAEGVRA